MLHGYPTRASRRLDDSISATLPEHGKLYLVWEDRYSQTPQSIVVGGPRAFAPQMMKDQAISCALLSLMTMEYGLLQLQGGFLGGKIPQSRMPEQCGLNVNSPHATNSPSMVCPDRVDSDLLIASVPSVI